MSDETENTTNPEAGEAAAAPAGENTEATPETPRDPVTGEAEAPQGEAAQEGETATPPAAE